MKVTVPQIKEALTLTGGDVKRASVVLGIARNNLYKRMAVSSIDPNEYRGGRAGRAADAQRAHAAAATQETDQAKSTKGTERDPVSRRAIFPAPVHGRNFRRVSTPVAAVSEEPPKALRISRTVYLRPEQVKALDDACLDLPRVLREKLSPSKVVEKFMDDCFSEWLRSKLSVPTKAKDSK